MASISPETPAAGPITAPEASPATEKTAGTAATDIQAKRPPLKKVRVPPPGYKFVRLPKPDGTFYTVQRPLSPEELATQEAKKKKKNEAAKSVATQKNVTTSKDPMNPKATLATNTILAKDISATSPKSPSATQESTLNSPDNETKKAQDPANSPEELMDPEKLKVALEEQTMRNREKRYGGFKRSIIGGLARVVGYAIPSIEIGTEWQDGDMVVHHADDPSDDDDFEIDDDHHGAEDHDQSGNQQDKDIVGSGDINSLEHLCKSLFCCPYFMKYPPTNLRSATQPHTLDVQVQTGAAITALSSAMTPTIANSTAQKQGPTPAQSNGKPSQCTGKPESEKVTYNIKEVEAMEDKEALPLKAHWTNFSFYFMASLSIVLPALFIGILLMK
jgi:hypothetical protein